VGTPFPLSHDSCRQPQTYAKPEAAVTVFELLMMGGVSPETCWTIKKYWNNKFYYTVASCWFFLWVLLFWDSPSLLLPLYFETLPLYCCHCILRLSLFIVATVFWDSPSLLLPLYFPLHCMNNERLALNCHDQYCITVLKYYGHII